MEYVFHVQQALLEFSGDFRGMRGYNYLGVWIQSSNRSKDASLPSNMQRKFWLISEENERALSL
ncbi:hypothetical protein ASE11_01550 [Hydrogenophaga sp. Root209]|nr:hypothetical protein ASE11_01550 [Hydrogenophaga sp. Root209]